MKASTNATTATRAAYSYSIARRSTLNHYTVIPSIGSMGYSAKLFCSAPCNTVSLPSHRSNGLLNSFMRSLLSWELCVTVVVFTSIVVGVMLLKAHGLIASID